MDVRVGGASFPYPPTPEGKTAAERMPLPETPAGIKPTARQLAFIPSPIPATVPAARVSPHLAATNIVATINQKRQEIAKAATAAANELEELEATVMALGAIVPSSPNQPTNPPTFNTAAVLQRPNNEQEATRPPAHPTTIPMQYLANPLSPAAQKPGQHQADNATPDNNANQPYS